MMSCCEFNVLQLFIRASFTESQAIICSEIHSLWSMPVMLHVGPALHLFSARRSHSFILYLRPKLHDPHHNFCNDLSNSSLLCSGSDAARSGASAAPTGLQWQEGIRSLHRWYQQSYTDNCWVPDFPQGLFLLLLFSMSILCHKCMLLSLAVHFPTAQ